MVSRRGAVPDDNRNEAGVTMVELIVTMFVFAIFLAIVTSSLIGITKASTKAQTVSRSSTGVLNVFQAFDRSIRYADVINPPGATSNGRYVEFRTPAATTGGAATCVQWRYVPSSKTLQSRQWPDGAIGSATAWATKLSSVFDKGGNYPFVLIPAGSAGSSMQQLTLTVVAGDAAQKTAEISTTFVARNSDVGSNSGGPVCSAGTMRP
ncbi:PulJ/GspJ family protein [Parafrigoribacterium humi]|uniref:PulJ/GspJ family protein n=1 Tax=Parafrigoribacterium humi TaxID=3144664 RepID=UPI0032EBBF45